MTTACIVSIRSVRLLMREMISTVQAPHSKRLVSRAESGGPWALARRGPRGSIWTGWPILQDRFSGGRPGFRKLASTVSSMCSEGSSSRLIKPQFLSQRPTRRWWCSYIKPSCCSWLHFSRAFWWAAIHAALPLSRQSSAKCAIAGLFDTILLDHVKRGGKL